MKRLLPLLLLATSAHAEGGPHKLYRWSIAALIAGSTADAASTWGQNEINPVLGSGRFGMGQVAVKGGIVAGALLIQGFMLKRQPQTEHIFDVGNFAMGAAFGAVAVRNWRSR
jgi:hypothetical protein